MKTMGKDANLLRVELAENGAVSVEGETIGHLDGFRFVVDSQTGHEDRKLLLAAAERHMPELLAQKAAQLIASEFGELTIEKGEILRAGQPVASLLPGKSIATPRIELTKELGALGPQQRAQLAEALDLWLARELAPLAPLTKLEEATHDPKAGSELRALLLAVIAGNGIIPRERAGLAQVPPERRRELRKLGVTIGALDVFVPALLKPAPRKLLRVIGADRRFVREDMASVIPGDQKLPAGYRHAGKQAIRVDMAEKLFRAAHESRAAGKRRFIIDIALPTSMGLAAGSFVRLMREAGFRKIPAPVLAEGVFGPAEPDLWEWRAPRKDQAAPRQAPAAPREGSAFAALADLMR